MKIIDLSWPITEKITAYKDKKMVEFIFTKEFAEDNSRESKIVLSSHTGTHVDAPSHFLENGKTINQIPLEKLIGKCQILDLTECREFITKSDLKKFNISENEIIILKTKNSYKDVEDLFDSSFIYLEKTGAEYLAALNVKAVGIDYLGIERNQAGHPTHKTLLGKNIPVIEGLRLSKVDPGFYNFYCLPLNIVGLEASPARAILISE